MNNRSPIVSLLTIFSLVLSLCSGILVMDKAGAQTKGASSERSATFTRDLTLLARQGKLKGSANRNAVKQVESILSHAQQNNPVLITESSTDSLAVVETLARSVVSGEVPNKLRGTRVLSLNINQIFDGAKTPAELQERLNSALSEVLREDQSPILFVDQLQHFLGERAASIRSVGRLADIAAGGAIVRRIFSVATLVGRCASAAEVLI